ncbi:hypothetical protein TRFO_17482 [Tritrichomonas foetus]|uniref:Uncharacterized protein n=1 Tax=Tritrichomonas foetus TaxID=1144522 RepID=A0A1J4KSL5_9EUKA|nr:hypothetical protein TRFO_17482 [Tritrichomonas foetus]|eukprot:OHT12654.1 hypothetical protein TRFO_17482 [Tritrichomonas foetus]
MICTSLENNMIELMDEGMSYNLFNRQFLKGIKAGLSDLSQEEVDKNRNDLYADDIYKQCDAINFFSDYPSLINQQIISRIFEICSQTQDFDVNDCINGFIENMSTCRQIINNSELILSAIPFLLFFTKSNIRQFVVTAIRAIAIFAYSNIQFAQIFLSNGFFHECFLSFNNSVETLIQMDNEDSDEINDILYLIEAILFVLSSIFIHSNIISVEYSILVVSCFHRLLDVQTPESHVLKLKVLVFDNVYWFAQSAPEEALNMLLSQNFLEITKLMLQHTKDQVKCSVLESIAQISRHGTHFVEVFLNSELLKFIHFSGKWSNETKYAFNKFLRCISICSDPNINGFLMTSEISGYLNDCMNNGSFNAQKEALIIILHLIMMNQPQNYEFFISQFLDCLSIIPEYFDKADVYFCKVILCSTKLLIDYLEAKSNDFLQKFLQIIGNNEWDRILQQMSESEDSMISKLSFDILEKLDHE